ncbi:MAG: hypothetical protein JST58_04135 [Bacteroidetes bacterium]|nr:hypothetical protein [Bacteroidota bacterium]
MRKGGFIIILFFALSSFAYGQRSQGMDCSVLKKYKLQYLSIQDTSAYIRLSNDSLEEFHNNGKYSIMAKLDWTNDCEYDMILSSVNIPNFPYRPGDVMHVMVEKIENDIVYYISTINGNSWEGRLRILR